VMKPLILCTVLVVVTACATEHDAGAPPSTETAAVRDNPALPPSQGAAAHTIPEAPRASLTVPSNPPPSQLGLPRTMSDKLPQPLAGATTSEGDRPPPPVTSPTGPALSFFDTNSFDKQLSSSLRRGSETIVVNFEAFPSVNAIPERLNKWFSAVE